MFFYFVFFFFSSRRRHTSSVSAFLLNRSSDLLNIYNNYFKAPWMPDRTEANPNELNQDDARYGFRCCHLKNIWTAPLPPETELSRQMTTSTTSIDIMGLQAAYANRCGRSRSEERFSRNAETDLVCRLLLEKKKKPPEPFLNTLT